MHLTERKEGPYSPRESLWDWGASRNGEAACPVCGREFEQRSRNQLYCSAECRKQQYSTKGKEQEWK